MANGRVEIYDPISNNNDHNNLTDSKSTSDTDSMGDTAELRVLMAYAKRRRPKKESSTPTDLVTGGTHVKRPSSPQTPAKTEKEEKKKKKKKKTTRRRKGWKHLRSIFICIKPQTAADSEPPQNTMNIHDADDRCFVLEDNVEILKEEDYALEEVAERLTEIADQIPFLRPELESDAPEDKDVEKMIGLLLRDAGDRLNEKEQIDAAVIKEIFWNYSFFEKLITTLLMRMGLVTDPNAPGPQASPKAHIAVTCEVTSRLSAGDTLPMNRMLNYGARYLQQHYSSWAQQQGGYEAAFHSEDEDEVQ